MCTSVHSLCLPPCTYTSYDMRVVTHPYHTIAKRASIARACRFPMKILMRLSSELLQALRRRGPSWCVMLGCVPQPSRVVSARDVLYQAAPLLYQAAPMLYQAALMLYQAAPRVVPGSPHVVPGSPRVVPGSQGLGRCTLCCTRQPVVAVELHPCSP